MDQGLIMGTSCSTSAQQNRARTRRGGATETADQRKNPFRERTGLADGNNATPRKLLRFSVVDSVPDDTIALLYPPRDNYVIVGETENGLPLRSPKTLVALCVDTLCRSLPYLDGALPRGLPHDVVEEIVQSLLDHSALNASTLAALRFCQLSHLSLAGCRGVTDAWLVALTSGSQRHHQSARDSMMLQQLLHDDDELDQDQDTNHNHNPMDTTRPHFQDDGSTFTVSSYVSAHEEAMLMSNQPEVNTDDEAIYMDTSQHEDDIPVVLFEGLEDEREDDPQMYQVTLSDDDYTPHFSESLVTLDLRGCQLITDNGLMHLTCLYALKEAYLNECHSLTGDGLLVFAESYDLVTLSLPKCRRLRDEGIMHISHLDSLKDLNLSCCRCLTDQSLLAISQLHDLRSLDLSLCDEITDSGLDNLSSLERLTNLRLGWCRQVSDAGIQCLSGQPGRSTTLQVLELSRTEITDDCLPAIARLTSLQELDLRGCTNLSSLGLGNALANLGQLTNLNVAYCPAILRSNWQGKINSLATLELNYSSVKDSHLIRLLNLNRLQELKLGSCPVGDVAIAHMANNKVMPNLRVLDLSDTDVTDQSMPNIAKFTKLERLSLFCCSITNRGLRHIGTLLELQALDLDSRDVTDDGLVYLKDLKKLKSLDLFSGRFTDAGCYYISNMTSLESLELCGGAISDMGCCRLASRLSQLANLNLSQNDRITNRGAAALAALLNLETLNLSNTRVDSHGLKFFSDLRKLKALSLYGCRIYSERHIMDLLNRLPMLRSLRLDSVNQDDGIVVGNNVHSSVEDDGSISLSDFD